ncbi:hypothetical protein N7494_008583 [Penicillium frequentans]|uniref:Protein kinase domain-containing protein n=1 Tax=Penicillium frequentans TaxID=3151616 RepID=A0AAD6CN61_9EURO|nr:hypothetical protein N7494_008583 [Penicillium glabrum]
MHEWILQSFMPILQEIPPLDPTHNYTLEDYLFSEEFHYTVKAVEDSMIPVHLSNTKNKKDCMMGAKLPSLINTTFPIYHPREIQVGIDETSAALPVYSGDVTGTTSEITAYSKIHTANFDPPVPTSRLKGIVQDDEGNILGLLLTYIECGETTLYRIDGQDPMYYQLRQKWVDQVSHTLERFHEHEIIWGDAKAANVLLDFDDDAYVVDFGGGYTKGWVEKEKSNSIEGDLRDLGTSSDGSLILSLSLSELIIECLPLYPSFISICTYIDRKTSAGWVFPNWAAAAFIRALRLGLTSKPEHGTLNN